MGGLGKSLRKAGEFGADPLHIAPKNTKKIGDTIDEAVFGASTLEEPENPNPELPKVIEMPDEDAIAKARKRRTSRRRGAAQGGGRGGTILSDGLGG